MLRQLPLLLSLLSTMVLYNCEISIFISYQSTNKIDIYDNEYGTPIFVTSGMIRQCFPQVSQARVKSVEESPHERPKLVSHYDPYAIVFFTYVYVVGYKHGKPLTPSLR